MTPHRIVETGDPLFPYRILWAGGGFASYNHACVTTPASSLYGLTLLQAHEEVVRRCGGFPCFNPK